MKTFKTNVLLFFAITLLMVGCQNKPNQPQYQIVNKIETQPHDIVFGNTDAPNTIVLYASYHCKYCRYFFSRTYPDLKENYLDTDKIKLVVKWVDFSNNTQILYSLKSASCIFQYGKYEKFHELMLVNPSVVFSPEFSKLIDDIMMENSQIAECILSDKNNEYVQFNVKEFRDNKLNGTPCLILNNHAYSGFISYPNLVNTIKSEFNL